MNILDKIIAERKRLVDEGIRPRRLVVGPAAYLELLRAWDGPLPDLSDNMRVMDLNVVRMQDDGMRVE